MIRKHLSFSIITASELINPYTHAHLPIKPYISEEDLYAKIFQSAADLKDWKKTPLVHRKDLVTKLVQRVLLDKDNLKPLISEFTGKSYKNIEEEFRRVRSVSGKLIEDCEPALAEKRQQISSNGKILQNRLVFEPVGVTAIFPYYSEPIFDSLIHLIPCLISGNSALLKMSDFNHFLGDYFQKIAGEELGREGLINDTFIHPVQLPIFREFRSVKKIIYSGSQSSARKIFESLVTNRFIDCNLFYGGQDAAYVDSDADLELAAAEICAGAFYNNGQSYDCIKRLYVHQDIEHQFLQILSQKISELVLGDPTDPNTDIGPLTIPETALKFEELINDAINFDAQCLIGGMIVTDGKEKGLFCEPTLLHNCHSSMQIVQEQLNAPVLCASSLSGFHEFKQEVSQHTFGTGVRIFTKDPNKYRSELDSLEVGFISFNSGNMTDCDLPIEGWKHSGKGKILSQLSYEEYVVPKSYIIQAQP